jgi:hypothetical protein
VTQLAHRSPLLHDARFQFGDLLHQRFDESGLLEMLYREHVSHVGRTMVDLID